MSATPQGGLDGRTRPAGGADRGTAGPPDRADVRSFYHLGEGALSGKACRGTACFVARHLDPARWAAAVGQTPPIYCAGHCFAAPALVGETGRPRVEVRARQPVVLSRLAQGGAPTLASYRADGGYQTLAAMLQRPPEELVGAIEISGLRGRGGAGFPAGRKWRDVFAQPPGEKFVIANADEGDAGAYVDRFLMEEDPHALLEGMLLAGYATGAGRGWIYLRAEYPRAEQQLGRALAEAREAGLLGSGILGHPFRFTIDLHVGRGSYVCGEETALVRSLEGRRPEVMARPPYASSSGLWGRPTLLSNVETLVNVPWILRHGAEAYRALGFSHSRGTKVLSLNSLFQKPGLYEVEFGVTLREVVEGLGGGLRTGRLKGVLLGGPLTGLIAPEQLETRLGFEELRAIGGSLGHGGVVAFDDHTSLPELIHHVFEFGAAESCGKCAPCRLGSRRVERVFAGVLRQGAASPADAGELARLTNLLRGASLCGHGIGLGEFAASAWRHFGKELERCCR